MTSPPIRVQVFRGDTLESQHVVHAAVVSNDDLTWTAGDSAYATYFRSSAKPFQAMPLVEDGVGEAFGWSPADLALCCASHSGEREHVAGVRALLSSVDLDESDLECGLQEPYGRDAARSMAARGSAGAESTTTARESTPGCWRWRGSMVGKRPDTSRRIIRCRSVC